MNEDIFRCLDLVRNHTLHLNSNCTELFHKTPWFKQGLLNITRELVTTSDFDVWRYLNAKLEPRRDDLTTVIFITVLYCILFFTGVFGNICTCIVIARNKFMHTATNYYLFNLAVADLLLLLSGLPPELYSIWSVYPWIFGEPACIIRALFAEVSTFTSILTITAFTVERYVAICHPMKAQKMSSLHRAIRVILSTWFIATACAIPQAIQYGVTFIDDSVGNVIEESARCTLKFRTNMKWTFVLFTVLFFAIPMTFILVLYTFIAIAIRRSAMSRGSMDNSCKEYLRGTDLHAQQQARARRSVIKMLVAVVVAFFVCWAPFHAERMMAIYASTTLYMFGAHRKILYLSGICYFMSGTINPVLYSIMSLKFRQAFKQTLLQPCCRRSTRHRQSHFSYKFVHRNGQTETSYTSVGPVVHAGIATPAAASHALQNAGVSSRTGSGSGSGNQLHAHNSRTSSSQNKRESITRSISGSSLRSTDDMCHEEEDIQQILFQIKCYDNNRNTAELVIGVC